jgi:hypothetical protein
MYEDMIRLYTRGGDAYIALAEPLWAVAALELWLDAGELVTPGGAVEPGDSKTGAFLDR